jgi:hypothetical protein
VVVEFDAVATENRHESVTTRNKSIVFLTAVTIGIAIVAALQYWRRPPIDITIRDVTGYTDPRGVWMPFRLNLVLTNTSSDRVTVQQIHVVPDLEGFNEAYNLGQPEDLAPPLVIPPGQRTNHVVGITLLNANQMQEGTYLITFRIRLTTSAGEIERDIEGELDYAVDPTRRRLRYAT